MDILDSRNGNKASLPVIRLDLIKISIGTSHGPNSESLLVIFYKV
jgi:hypothetical protein